MRVDNLQGYSITAYRNQQKLPTVKIGGGQKSSYRLITFSGLSKNLFQVASFTPENNGLGLSEAAQGGEGCVGYEVVASHRKHEHIDARSFMPFWEYDNPKGGYKFLIHRKSDFPNGIHELPDQMPAKLFYSANPGEKLEDVAKKLGLGEDELSYVIQSRPNGSGPNALSRYCRLEQTSVNGVVERLSDTKLGEVEQVPYSLLKISQFNPSYNKLKGQPHYFVYTPNLAKASKPYSYDCFGNVPFEAEIINSDWMRALADSVHSKMNTEEFGFFNPGNVYCHDRVCHTYPNHIANKSFRGDNTVNGLKMHVWVHNSGRNYQGLTGDAFKFLTLVGDAQDAKTLRGLPDFELLSKAKQYGIQSLSPHEQQIVNEVLGPVLAPFKDGSGMYNVLKTGIAAVKANPENVSLGTVSYEFEKEMKSPNTPDAAKFLTGDYASIETKSVLNGVTPANLRLDDNTADFGHGGNGLSAKKSGYTPFSYDGKNIENVVQIKEKNAKWLTRLIWNASKKGQDELNKLFFNEGQIIDGHNVMGQLSPLRKGQILVFGFGRPDEQKGYNISIKGYLEFLKDESIPKWKKRNVKLMLGAGPWNKNADDYKDIVKYLNEIWALDKGAYKNNVMYIDGFTPNRFVGCCTHGLFTSRREMCGVTPIEAKIGATPYGVTATGGPVDYTNSLNGWLTDEAVELRPEHYGLSYDKNSAWEIDQARVNSQAKQVKKNIFEVMIDEYTNDRPSYIAKCKKNIEEQVDWHNNSEYNHGKSANKRYLEDILEIDKGWEVRNKNPLKRLLGDFGTYTQEVEEIMVKKGKILPRPFRFVYGIIGAAAVFTGVYFLVHGKKKSSNKILNLVA